MGRVGESLQTGARLAASMNEAFICDFVRTPIGRYEGGLSRVRADDLAAAAIKHLIARNSAVGAVIEEVFFGCANQAGEDNRNVARMALLLAGLPAHVPGVTLNRLCASGLDAVAAAARAIRAGDVEIAVAGGVESMTRAPFVMGKAERAFQRTAEIYDTTIGWRFINAQMKALYGVDSMPETGENVAADFNISREDQDAFAFRSQQRAARAQSADRARDDSANKGRRRPDRRTRRAAAAGDDAGGARKAQTDRARRRHRDRGECVGDQ